MAHAGGGCKIASTSGLRGHLTGAAKSDIANREPSS
jgi:hypothetical protein